MNSQLLSGINMKKQMTKATESLLMQQSKKLYCKHNSNILLCGEV